jgi:hypothetical protein
MALGDMERFYDAVVAFIRATPTIANELKQAGSPAAPVVFYSSDGEEMRAAKDFPCCVLDGTENVRSGLELYAGKAIDIDLRLKFFATDKGLLKSLGVEAQLRLPVPWPRVDGFASAEFQCTELRPYGSSQVMGTELTDGSIAVKMLAVDFLAKVRRKSGG